MWLDDVTTFPSGIRKIEAWSQSEWLEATFPVWSSLCDPIAAKAVDAMGSMLAVDPSTVDSGDMPAEMRAMLSGMGGLSALAPMMRQLGGAMLGGQIGTAIGELAGDMATSTDIGLPLAPEGTAALLPSGVTRFGEGAVGRHQRGAAVPRAARGGPPPAVRARAVAAPAPARRRRGLREQASPST